MYERFTDRARKVFQLANQEAQRFNHEYVRTEHLLIAMVKEGSGVAANVLGSLNVKLCVLRDETEKAIQPSPHVITMGKLPQSPAVQETVRLAIAEARNFGHNHVGTEHVLLGMLGPHAVTACKILEKCGATQEAIREAVRKKVATYTTTTAQPRDSAAVLDLLQRAFSPADFAVVRRLVDLITLQERNRCLNVVRSAREIATGTAVPVLFSVEMKISDPSEDVKPNVVVRE